MLGSSRPNCSSTRLSVALRIAISLRLWDTSCLLTGAGDAMQPQCNGLYGILRVGRTNTEPELAVGTADSPFASSNHLEWLNVQDYFSSMMSREYE